MRPPFSPFFLRIKINCTDALSEKLVAGTIGIEWCPETESNRHVLLRTRDFKSRASASFAIRAGSKPLKRIYQLIL